MSLGKEMEMEMIDATALKTKNLDSLFKELQPLTLQQKNSYVMRLIGVLCAMTPEPIFNHAMEAARPRIERGSEQVHGVQFCSDLQLLKHQAMELSLYRTIHRLDGASRMAGWEVAGNPEACLRYEAAQEEAGRKARACVGKSKS